MFKIKTEKKKDTLWCGIDRNVDVKRVKNKGNVKKNKMLCVISSPLF